jgi:hypothetical protein
MPSARAPIFHSYSCTQRAKHPRDRILAEPAVLGMQTAVTPQPRRGADPFVEHVVMAALHGIATAVHAEDPARRRRARIRSRIASWATSGIQTAVSSPARCSLASASASRRSVLTRSPALIGIRDAASMQLCPRLPGRWRSGDG